MNPVLPAPAPVTTVPVLSSGSADDPPGVGFDALLADRAPPPVDAAFAASQLLLPLLPGLPVFLAPAPGSGRPGDPTPPRTLNAGPWGTELGVQLTVLAWEPGEVDPEIAGWIDELAAATPAPGEPAAAAPTPTTPAGADLAPADFDEEEPTAPRLARPHAGPAGEAAAPRLGDPRADARPVPPVDAAGAAAPAPALEAAAAAAPPADGAERPATAPRRPRAARTWSPEDAAEVAAAGVRAGASSDAPRPVGAAEGPVPEVDAAPRLDPAQGWVPGRLRLAVEDATGGWEMDLHRHHGVMDLVLRGGDDLGLLVRDHWRELREALVTPEQRAGELRHEPLAPAPTPDAATTGGGDAPPDRGFERWRSAVEAREAGPLRRAPANRPTDPGAAHLLDRRL